MRKLSHWNQFKPILSRTFLGLGTATVVVTVNHFARVPENNVDTKYHPAIELLVLEANLTSLRVSIKNLLFLWHPEIRHQAKVLSDTVGLYLLSTSGLVDWLNCSLSIY